MRASPPPLWESAEAVCTENIVSPPTKPVGCTAKMKVELRWGGNKEGADTGRIIARVMFYFLLLARCRAVGVENGDVGGRKSLGVRWGGG